MVDRLCIFLHTHRNNLHQAQYVSKLEDLIRFMMTAKALTAQHLTVIWQSQVRFLCPYVCID